MCCVGEVGLDASPRVLEESVAASSMSIDDVKAFQKNILRQEIELAIETGLALNVHSRGAGHHTIDFIVEQLEKVEKSRRPRVLMHAFDGKQQYAIAAVEKHGFFFSVAPSIVRDPQLQKLVKALPLSALLLESDSPRYELTVSIVKPVE
jgi:TatD DNase family protein